MAQTQGRDSTRGTNGDRGRQDRTNDRNDVNDRNAERGRGSQDTSSRGIDESRGAPGPTSHHHDNAAFHHESAAHHHREASRHYDAGNSAEGRRHADMAHSHGRAATDHNEDARFHGRSADRNRQDAPNVGRPDASYRNREAQSMGRGGEPTDRSRGGHDDEEDDRLASNADRSRSGSEPYGQSNRNGRHD